MIDENIELYLMFCCFCGFLFVVVDVEIVGFNLEWDVFFEVVVVLFIMNNDGYLECGEIYV